MMKRVKKLGRLVRKAIVAATGVATVSTIPVALAQTNGSTIDLSVLGQILTAVLPIFVLIAVLRMLFGAFRDWT